MIQGFKFSCRTFIHLCCSLVIIPLLSFNVGFSDIGNEILEAFKSNKAKSISNYFGSNISLSIKSDGGYYSKFQAEMLLSDFFQANKTTEIKQVQRTMRTNNSFYIVYQLKTSSGTYRVFTKFSQTSGDTQIAELRIE